MDSKKIEEIAKEYLISKKLWSEPTNEKDRCFLTVKELGDIFYVECHACYFQGMLYPGDEGYPSQAGGYPCDSYKSIPSYRLVYDKMGNIIIDPAEIVSASANIDLIACLDSENIILPIKEKDDWIKNHFQHYKKKNGKFTLVKTFEGLPNTNKNLLDKNFVAFGGTLYNFEKECIINTFDKILTGGKYAITYLAGDWGIPSEHEKEFVDIISEKMKTNGLIGGYKKVKVQKEGICLGYDTLTFIDKNGRHIGDLYYVDNNYNFITIENVTSENYESIIQSLTDELICKIDALISEKKNKNENKNEILSRVRQRLASVSDNKSSL